MLGDALGLDDEDDLNELEMEMMNEEQEESQEKKLRVTMFITIDEDDDNKHGVNLQALFRNEGNEKPFSVEVEIRNENNCKEMVFFAIEKFNKRLTERESTAPFTLDEDQNAIDSNYTLYIAKKKGNPKDDFPGLSMTSNAMKANYERFCLACFSSAFVPREGFEAPVTQ
mmetsp:Transcript_2067/g.3652  ORF Transcript_2067/g.3652 Transcript_2067/m.3652 type:complete len:170 (-) Transcript_2067:512-1021(-)